MKNSKKHLVLSCLVLVIMFLSSVKANAKFIVANSSNYTTFLTALVSGDTLYLSAGIYKNSLTLNGVNGIAASPIVIMGSASLYSTIFQAQVCCNTVSITKCSYLTIKNMQLDGQNIAVDAVKAEGTVGNFAHHITLEYLNIINYGNNQNTVAISTKCSAWDWIIRKNRILGAGTGLYLGNSDGTRPFVNGLIENNYIANTIGYNVEIKHQFNGVRDSFPETKVDGKTTICYNVFTKDSSSSFAANARPNLLVGGFPTIGWGAKDRYEIYGNFFYNNPVEALFQGTGNISIYHNIFVNHFDPIGFRALYIAPQNGVSPQDIKVFQNTIWVANSSGGLRLYNPNTSFNQYCYANAVFASQPITNFVDSLNNITSDYQSAGNYVLSANTSLAMLDLYPQSGKLKGSFTPSAVLQNSSQWDKDFNNNIFDWSYRGAYSGCCINPGWHLKLDTIPSSTLLYNAIKATYKNTKLFLIFPNPSNANLHLLAVSSSEAEITDLYGNIVKQFDVREGDNILNLDLLTSGVYFIRINSATGTQTLKWTKQ